MSARVLFGPFAFDPATGELRKHGTVIRLQPQPARLLALLVARAGDIVSREELRQQIWPEGTFVDFERGLNFSISQVRSALGDSASRPLYLETLPKRGYRFIAPLTPEAGTATPVPVSEPPARRWNRPRLAWAVAGVGVVAVTLVLWATLDTAAVRVAVVPFDNETGQDAFDRVAVSIADQTVARLAAPERLDRLSVIGNSAALKHPRTFRDIKAIGQAVDADYIVLAQMKMDASAVRLIAHLIRISDESHLWANVFDRPTFSLDAQAEIAEAIASAVATRLSDL